MSPKLSVWMPTLLGSAGAARREMKQRPEVGSVEAVPSVDGVGPAALGCPTGQHKRSLEGSFRVPSKTLLPLPAPAQGPARLRMGRSGEKPPPCRPPTC